MNKTRDLTYDILKLTAIIFVVMGHIFQRFFISYDSIFIYNVIWALQIPLFTFVSGCFVDNSGRCSTFMGLLTEIGKKAIAYLIPFFSFFIINYFVFNVSDGNFFSALISLPFNLDYGLWFLFVLFLLNTIFNIALFLKSRFHSDFWQKASFLVSLIFFLGIFLMLAWKVGMDFLGSKLVLYYSLFYAAGFLYFKGRKVIEKIKQKRSGSIAYDAFFCFTFISFFLLIILFPSQFSLLDNVQGISIRLTTSFLGIILCLEIAKKLSRIKKLCGFFSLGKYSLEIYYAHLLIRSLFPKNLQYSFFTVEGISFYLLSFSILILGTAFFIFAVKQSKVADFLFFGKLPPENLIKKDKGPS